MDSGLAAFSLTSPEKGGGNPVCQFERPSQWATGSGKALDYNEFSG
jgi:hypothetical protein